MYNNSIEDTCWEITDIIKENFLDENDKEKDTFVLSKEDAHNILKKLREIENEADDMEADIDNKEDDISDLEDSVDFFDSNWDEQLFEVLKQQLFLTKEYINEINDPDLCVAMTDADEMQEVGCCTGAINEFHIYPNGDIYPCVYTAGNPKYICGSVKTGIDKEKVDSYKKIYKTSIKQCEGCTYYRGCPSTRCKFLNEVLTGDLYTPSPAMCLTQNTCISVYHYL